MVNYLVYKRVFDLVLSITLIILLFVIMILIAVTIKITSPGAVFYWSNRVGRNKKNFSMRYLREYITTAYKTVNEKMSPEKFKAMNYLDKLLYSEKFQRRFKLKEGEIIIINNKILAHGRTSFAINQLKPRKILRVWYN